MGFNSGFKGLTGMREIQLSLNYFKFFQFYIKLHRLLHQPNAKCYLTGILMKHL